MKKFNQIPVLIFLLISIISCKNDEEKESLSMATISAKWVVSGSNGGYESFEFKQSGNYILVMNTETKSTAGQTILFGTYQIIDNETIELSDLGEIKITSIDKNNFSFSLTIKRDLNKHISIVAIKAAEFASSARMEILCRTWKIVTIDGENVEGTEDAGTVLFSAAGTYLVTWYDGENGLAQWKWKDSNETIMCYSWDGEPTCNGENEVKILELTQNSVTVSEEFDDETIVYVLVPVSGKKSAQLKAVNSGTQKPIRKGLFSR
jgi:hypothetical protein